MKLSTRSCEQKEKLNRENNLRAPKHTVTRVTRRGASPEWRWCDGGAAAGNGACAPFTIALGRGGGMGGEWLRDVK